MMIEIGKCIKLGKSKIKNISILRVFDFGMIRPGLGHRSIPRHVQRGELVFLLVHGHDLPVCQYAYAGGFFDQ